MLIIVVVSTDKVQIKPDTSSFVQKPYLGSNYIKSKTDKNTVMKTDFENKKLPDPTSDNEVNRKRMMKK